MRHELTQVNATASRACLPKRCAMSRDAGIPDSRISWIPGRTVIKENRAPGGARSRRRAAAPAGPAPPRQSHAGPLAPPPRPCPRLRGRATRARHREDIYLFGRGRHVSQSVLYYLFMPNAPKDVWPGPGRGGLRAGRFRGGPVLGGAVSGRGVSGRGVSGRRRLRGDPGAVGRGREGRRGTLQERNSW